MARRADTGRSWVPAVLFVVVLVSALAAAAVGLMTEYGWLWGHERRGQVFFVAVGVSELALLAWWARARRYRVRPFVVGGVLVLVYLGVGPNWFLVAAAAVAGAWLARSRGTARMRRPRG